MKRFIAVIALAAVAGSAGAEQTWIPFSDTIAVRAGSFEMRATDRTQSPLATVIVRWKTRNNQFTFDRAGILISDCERGYGKIRSYDIDSGAFKDQFDYVNGGGNVAANLGDSLCSLAERDGNTNTSRRY